MKFRLLIAASAVLVSACVSVLPEPEVPNGLYRLGNIQPSASLTRNLVVREPEGGRVFGGKTLASESEDGALRLIRGAEWAEPASRMLQIGLLDAFGTDGGGVAVEKGVGAPGELELAWRMSDFTVSGVTARCELELTLLNGRTREPIMQRHVETVASVESNKPGDRANALAEAAEECIQETASVIAAVDAGL